MENKFYAVVSVIPIFKKKYKDEDIEHKIVIMSCEGKNHYPKNTTKDINALLFALRPAFSPDDLRPVDITGIVVQGEVLWGETGDTVSKAQGSDS